MLDFLMIATRSGKRGIIEIYPKFIIKKSNDLMIRGGDFYAIWIDERGLWSTDEQDAVDLIDRELDRYTEENRKRFDDNIRVLHMWDAETGMIDTWHRYCQKQMKDQFHMLDEKLIFTNTKTGKRDYASKSLSYPLEKGDTPAWDKLVGTLYSPEERHKIEWCIGAIVTGDSKKLQKFMVFYGAMGTGKSTIIKIIEQLFEGYHSSFSAKDLGSSSNAFALEAFRSNPLVAIEHDGKLSRLEDNTRLNSLVSHEKMIVNEKFKSTYSSSFKTFLIMGTNEPVRITDAKSGLLRRLIDVSPTGNLIPKKEYDGLLDQVKFELGGIAYRCREVYLNDPDYYEGYIPIAMMGATNDFYNFVVDSYFVFKREDGVSLKSAWEMYKTYCDDAKVPYPMSRMKFQEELKNYFRNYDDRPTLADGTRVRNYYSGFRTEKFEEQTPEEKPDPPPVKILQLDCTESIFDKICADCPAQYATSSETPTKKWDNVKQRLKDLDTTKLHYVIPLPTETGEHIVADFDFKDAEGKKDTKRNLEEAAKWPPTYAELSKGGGVHLHYIYTGGDASKLSRVYDDHIEIKVFTGNSSLRRKLSKCNNLPIATISSGLPLKGENNVVNTKVVQSEKGLRLQIKRNLNKEIHPATKPSIDFIHKILTDAYESGMTYDVTDMRNAVLAFAANSTNQAEYCIKLVNKMPFKSAEDGPAAKNDEAKLVFYDVEVFPNLFLVNWKIEGPNQSVVRMINPKPQEIEELMKFRLVGFNCRRYDNHILYARLMGYTEEQLYNLSQKIISSEKKAKSNNCFFGEAYNASYTDVYDFCSKKQSLKKWEIELGIHHQELGLPWDQPVPEHLWQKVAEYCDNDVIATEAVFNARKADFVAREILADVAGMTVNDTTNTLTARIIFGGNRKPQDVFNYRDMGDESQIFDPDADLPFTMGPQTFDKYTAFDKKGRPIFPGYKFENGKSIYRGEEVGEGGYVYAEPGMYGNIALLDIASMHPSSIIAEVLFGPDYTKRFQEIRDARVAIKHKDFEKAKKMLNGALAKYLTDESAAADLAQALKIAINSVYGLTIASFDNPFRDNRNKDNIVAKRGALFMINLKHEVQKRGFTVAHIKTDSIKIPDATPEIIQFVMDYGKLYGYTFEHEATYDRMCLVNNAVYIAKYKDGKHAGEWTATGTQFQIPYVFKKLFSHEEIVFEDMCETKSVAGALYLDTNENLPDVSALEKELAKLQKEDPALDCEELKKQIAEGHNYVFVGKVGQFCPMKPGYNGGLLLREVIDKKTGEKSYATATGAKGYRWLESEMVKQLGKEDGIDRSYYDAMVDAAVHDISQYGDFEWFVSDDPYIQSNPSGDTPPWETPGEPWKEDAATAFDVR